MKKNSWIQMLKFTLFSISAGLIQIGSFTLIREVIGWKDYWPVYLISLTLSVLWNFTLNRRYTFMSAANVPLAMAELAGFYLVFTPLSTWLGDLAAKANINEYIILAVTMISNFVLEFLFSKFVMYRNKENTLVPKKQK